MKKSRIYWSFTALVLACTGFFAVKANKKFTSPTVAYYLNGATWVQVLGNLTTAGVLTETVISGHIVKLGDATSGSGPYTLYWAENANDVIYNKGF